MGAPTAAHVPRPELRLNLSAIPLFRFRGIPVQLHWSWVVVGAIEVMWRSDTYGHWAWNVAEYLMLFGIVLLHEFGHAFACRQVGGTVDRILLWPLGGVAQVRPPQRPAAQLWSIVAGPLVNLVLVVPALALWMLLPDALLGEDVTHALNSFVVINIALFVFNMLPIYPLDGGQVLRSMLWFAVGRERSLLVAAGIGLVAALGGGVAAAVWLQDFWLVALGAFAAWRSWVGIRAARAQQALNALPTHPLARCPSCGEAPPAGSIIRCENGHPVAPYDTVPPGRCRACGAAIAQLPCIHCHQTHRPIDALQVVAHTVTTTKPAPLGLSDSGTSWTSADEPI